MSPSVAGLFFFSILAFVFSKPPSELPQEARNATILRIIE